MVKVAVTNDNDILYNSLSNAFLQNELNIELIKVPYEKLEQIIFHNKAKDIGLCYINCILYKCID